MVQKHLYHTVGGQSPVSSIRWDGKNLYIYILYYMYNVYIKPANAARAKGSQATSPDFDGFLRFSHLKRFANLTQWQVKI